MKNDVEKAAGSRGLVKKSVNMLVEEIGSRVQLEFFPHNMALNVYVFRSFVEC